MNSAGMPHWKANVAPPRRKLWPEYLAGSRPMREASDWMLQLRVEMVRRSGRCAFAMWEKAGALGETWTP